MAVQQPQHSLFGTAKRRSMRVFLSTPICVTGRDSKSREFAENTRTLVVNAHGALISLAAALTAGQPITVRTEDAQQSRECRVVYLESRNSAKSLLGIEFFKPAPAFWQIDYPPDDWVPTER